MVARRPCASAVVAAAGSGTRMGAAVPKQYLDLGGVPIVVRSIAALASSGAVGEMVAAVPSGDEERFEREIVRRYSLSSLFERGCTVVAGGSSRQASVTRALGAVSGEYEIVVVHDAARPLVTAGEVWAAVEAAMEWGAATCATAPTDTVKSVMAATTHRAAHFVAETLDRSRLRMIQTPQAFKLSVLREAHEHSNGSPATDDCALVERLGLPVAVVPGSRRNIKITNPLDLAVAEALLASESRVGAGAEANAMEMSGTGAAGGLEPPTIRLGQGFDLHRLAPGRRLVLGGVEIPASLGLVGHSDADVLTHAVIDALLGAAGLGDIGQHYPDTDPAYAGASSISLLSHTVDMLRAAGYRVCSLDTVVIAEQPKIGPFAAHMRESLANAMKVSPGCVNIKGKTTEGLGPTGTGEAIAALAVAMVMDMRGGAAV
ncbi:MAG: 2-C-methyl-D-erythritol 4-phosphate cytidylyltransferase [Bacillota bacterium]|jgi:2-C-methyl-D-erythritol 4-phosphate cytidylyltransferase/2-C-methyl-D-erythritol 2,4-cyclodiphosphate synthase